MRYAGALASVGVEWGLIGPGEPARIWPRHLLNCAAVAPLIPRGARVLDIGSGAGLPGLVLELARPDLRVCCVDGNSRRHRFVAMMIADLGLAAEARLARAEGLRERFEVVTARAVAPLPKLLELGWPLVAAGGVLLAIKGRDAPKELAAVNASAIGAVAATVEDCRIGTTRYATVVRLSKGGLA